MKRSLVLLSGLSLMLAAGCDSVKPPKKPATAPKTAVTAAPAAVAASPAAAPVVDDGKPLPAGVLARVGEWTLTKDEFNERVKGVKEMVKDFNDKDPAAKGNLLNELVRQQLLIQQARRDNLQDSKEIRAALKEFENTLLVQEIVTRLTKEVVVADADAKKYYENNPTEFQKPVEKQIREIVVATQSEAKDVLVQVLQGGDFAQLAKDRSKGKTKDNGGDLGFRTEATFPAMAAAVATLKKGGISSVFEGPEGFYIAKLEDTRGGELVGYDDVKADLLKFLKLRKQQDILANAVKDIQQRTKVQVNEDLLKATTGE